MTRYGSRVEAGIFRTGWAERVATALMAAVLFVLLLVVGALTAAIAIASALVIETKWWLSRRRLARRDANSLEVEYEVVPPDKDGCDQLKTATPGKNRNNALRPGS